MLLSYKKNCLIFWLLSLSLVTGLSCRLPSAFGCEHCGDFDYIYVQVHVTVQNERMERIDVSWNLSEIHSNSFLYEYDVNRNGRLDAEETDALSVFFLETLQTSDFFTTIYVNNRKLSAPDFENPRFEWNPTDKAFSFSVPLSYEINDMLDLTLQVMDPDSHFKFYYRHDSVTWNRLEGYRLVNNAASFPQELEIRIQP
jgi:ABC-type uncharacterized transport system substrate-binding protein